MDVQAFRMEYRDSAYSIEYRPNCARWADNDIGEDNPIRDINNWSREIKYLVNGELSDDIRNIPPTTGGIYIFYLKGKSLPFMEYYILYVGRAKLTDTMNIQTRAIHYIYDRNSRVNIKMMFDLWGNDLYYRYYSDTDNETIERNEALLIRAIVPPYNLEIPKRIDVQPSTNAF